MRQHAVLRDIEVLGEAAGQFLKLVPEAEARFPSIPFQRAYVTRNRLIHGYSSLRLSTIWEDASVHVPAMKQELSRLLAHWPADLA